MCMSTSFKHYKLGKYLNLKPCFVRSSRDIFKTTNFEATRKCTVLTYEFTYIKRKSPIAKQYTSN